MIFRTYRPDNRPAELSARTAALLTTGAAVCLFVLGVLWKGYGLLSDSGFFVFSSGFGGVVEFSTNSFYSWIFEPITWSILTHCSDGYFFYLGGLFVASSLGFFRLLRWVAVERGREERPAATFILSVGYSSTLLLLFGGDLLMLSALAILPWHIRGVSFLLGGYSPSRGIIVRFAGVCLLLAILGGDLGVTLGALSFAAVLSDRTLTGRPIAFLVAGLTFVPAILRLGISCPPPIPDYPVGAHVVAARGLLEHYRPMVGSDPAIISYDWMLARAMVFPYAAVGVVVSALLVGLALRCVRRDTERVPWAFPGIALAVFSAVLLDSSVVDPMWSQILPLQSLARLMPELSYLPTARIGLWLGVFFCFASIANCGRWQSLCAAIPPIVVLTLRLVPGDSYSRFEMAGSQRSLIELTSGESFAAQTKIFSPSFALFREFGVQRIRQMERDTSKQLLRVPHPGEVTLRSALGEQSLPFAVDGNLKTRWSTGAGGQRGGERIELGLPGLRLRALRLELGAYGSDFPRGLRLSAYDAAGQLCETIEESPWEGPVLFSPNGFPYFGPQQDVTIRFVNACVLSRLVIEQTKAVETFDWSIAEILIETDDSPAAG